MKNRETQLFKLFGMFCAVSILFFALPAALLAADSYPNKPVRLIIPFPPGGATDIVGRVIATSLSDRLGQQVIADNRGGAGGVLGTEMAARSAPDGYTLLFIPGAHVLNPLLDKVPYDPVKDFTTVAGVASGPDVLSIYPGLPVKSVKDLIALAKKEPGKLVCVASGSGSKSHLAAELFKSMAGIDIKIVQFKGGGPATIDVMGGHSHMMLGALVQMLSQIKAGKLKALGVGGTKRTEMLPGVPTIAEDGLPGFETSGWWGIIAPAGTPKAIIDRLNKELKVILDMPETKKIFLDQGAEPDYKGPEEFSKFLEGETATWGRVIREANIKAEK
jgi:tripartite-type tricarboxylate transporter receptor subunit TctC